MKITALIAIAAIFGVTGISLVTGMQQLESSIKQIEERLDQIDFKPSFFKEWPIVAKNMD